MRNDSEEPMDKPHVSKASPFGVDCFSPAINSRQKRETEFVAAEIAISTYLGTQDLCS